MRPKLKVAKETKPCPFCDGFGVVSCPKCNGAGTTIHRGCSTTISCAVCNGWGKRRCTHCVGTGRVRVTHAEREEEEG